MTSRFLTSSLFRSAAGRFVFFKSPSLTGNFHTANQLLYAAPIKLKMPSLSPTMTEGNIIKWHKKEGDKVAPGDVLMEIQTDKAVISFEVDEEGTIAKILIPEDTKNIKVGTLVGLMVLPGDDWKNVTIPADESAEKPKVEQSKPETSASSSSSSSASVSSKPQTSSSSHVIDNHSLENLKIGPAAKNLLIAYQIDPKLITPTGNRGFIMKNDVKAYIDKHNLSPVTIVESEKSPSASETSTTAPSQGASRSTPEKPEVDFEDIELTSMRRTIAKRLLESKTITPHSYITTDAVMDKIVDLRKEMISKNQKVSLNDFIIKASALALRIVPELNTNYNDKTGEYKQLNTVDISVAVATDAGLITPIVKDADKIEVLNISERVKDLADRARQNKLKLNEFQGGSFSISNLGMFGIKEFTAVINPPQIGILAVGKSQLTFSPELKKQTVTTFCLCYDERHVSLDRAKKFLNSLNYFLTNPELLVDQNQQL